MLVVEAGNRASCWWPWVGLSVESMSSTTSAVSAAKLATQLEANHRDITAIDLGVTAFFFFSKRDKLGCDDSACSTASPKQASLRAGS